MTDTTIVIDEKLVEKLKKYIGVAKHFAWASLYGGVSLGATANNDFLEFLHGDEVVMADAYSDVMLEQFEYWNNLLDSKDAELAMWRRDCNRD